MGDTPIILIGAGGHATVVAQCAQLTDTPILGLYDDDPNARLLTRPEAPERLGSIADFIDTRPEHWILALGTLSARRAIIARDVQRAAPPLIHPSASVAPDAEISEGVYIGPGAIIHASARIRAHAIINSGAIVEHDCLVDTNAHIAPGAVLCGSVTVGAHTLVGANATIIPGRTIGSGSTIGAGSTVVEDIPPNVTAVGTPARALGTTPY
jgi:sugar O-acyltransferase (sialic acid O-acetyltransferase NeuD family)